MILLDLGINMAGDVKDIRPPVVVVVHEARAPADVLSVHAQAGDEGDVGKSAVAIVVVEIRGVIGKVCLEDVQPAVAVVVSDAYAHPGLFLSVLVIGAT